LFEAEREFLIAVLPDAAESIELNLSGEKERFSAETAAKRVTVVVTETVIFSNQKKANHKKKGKTV